jgi:hypothetical protein
LRDDDAAAAHGDNDNQNKTKQNKTKQNKTKQNKTRQNKTKQDKTKINLITSILHRKRLNKASKGAAGLRQRYVQVFAPMASTDISAQQRRVRPQCAPQPALVACTSTSPEPAHALSHTAVARK